MPSVMHILRSFDTSGKAFGDVLMVLGEGGGGLIVLNGARGRSLDCWR